MWSKANQELVEAGFCYVLLYLFDLDEVFNLKFYPFAVDGCNNISSPMYKAASCPMGSVNPLVDSIAINSNYWERGGDLINHFHI